MNEKRGSLYLVTGLVLGLLIGVLVSQYLLPVRYTDTEPATLRSDQRELYRSLVARAFLVEADTRRATTRLQLLNDPTIVEDLIAQAQTALASPDGQQEARAMALLAASLSQPGLMITPLPARVTPIVSLPATATSTSALPTVAATFTATMPPPTPTPGSTQAPPATVTPLPTQGSPYQLLSREEVCSSPDDAPLLQVIVQDSQGNPVAGVKIEITLVNSAPTYFYTGLYPEISSGYADYGMTRDGVYSLRVGEGGSLVTGLQAPQCSSEGTSYTGGLKLVFQQP